MDAIVRGYGVSLSSWLVPIAAFLLAYNYINKQSWKTLPPGPPCLPIIGSLPFIGLDTFRGFDKLRKKYGDIFTVYIGSQRMIILNGLDTIKQAFVKQGNVLSGRPDLFWMQENARKMGIIAAEGDFWKEQRRFVLHVLKDVGFGKSIMEDKIKEEMGFFLDLMSENVRRPFNPRTLLQKSITNVVTSFAFGRRMEYNDPVFVQNLRLFNASLDALGPDSMLNLFPGLRYVPGDLFGYKTLLKSYEYFEGTFQGWIDDHKLQGEESEPTDFIGIYLQKIKKEENNPDSSFSEYQLMRIIDDLFAAGSDTTTTTLTWAIAFMALNPEIQETVQKEIDDIIGADDSPRMEHRPKMPYTEACLNEAQRLGDIAGISLPHSSSENITLMGYFIPKGSIIIPSMHSVHSDPEIWPEPEKFQPSRFLSDSGQLIKREELIAFSIGKRQCLGEGLARMELFLYFTSMMQRFRFTPTEGKDRPQYGGVHGFTYRPKPYKVILEPRI